MRPISLVLAWVFGALLILVIGLSAQKDSHRRIIDIEAFPLPTGVMGTQILYVAVASDGTVWQKLGVGKWEKQGDLPLKGD